MKRRGRPPYPDLLTPREQEVLALLRKGLSNEQIAQRLGVSLAGAKYHVSEILGKLGVSSRDEAARWRGEQRPWWLAAFAPFDFLRRRVGWLPTAVVGATALALVAATALLIWGLTRTDGADTLALSGPFCDVDTPASWQSTIAASKVPLPASDRFYASAVNANATLAFGAYYSPAWSGIAAIDPAGTVTRISPFNAPDNDSLWSAAFNGRWFAWTERHSSATLGASDLYVWDSLFNQITHPASSGVLGLALSDDLLAWSTTQTDLTGPFDLHIYSLHGHGNTVISNDKQRTPLLFADSGLLVSETIEGTSGSQLRMLDTSTGDLLPIPEPFASAASGSVAIHDETAAWASTSGVSVMRSPDSRPLEIFRSSAREGVFAPNISGQLVHWEVQFYRDRNFATLIADMRIGSIAVLPENTDVMASNANSLVIQSFADSEFKTSRPQGDLALVNTNDLPPLPRCAD